MTKKEFDFKKALKDLEEINEWFQKDDLDLDKGLTKLKNGSKLIKACKKHLTEVENEFINIKNDLASSSFTDNKEDNLNSIEKFESIDFEY